jgi:hypothetical protein
MLIANEFNLIFKVKSLRIAVRNITSARGFLLERLELELECNPDRLSSKQHDCGFGSIGLLELLDQPHFVLER